MTEKYKPNQVDQKAIDEMKNQNFGCYVPLMAELEFGIVKWGEKGYYATDWGKQANDIETLQGRVDKKNAVMGISPNVSATMMDCSMFDCWQNFLIILESYDNRRPTEFCKCCQKFVAKDTFHKTDEVCLECHQEFYQ
jgi:hypothetical protein